MLLYIHVPFCRKKCRYCAFASGPFSPEGMQTYVNLLLRELAFWSEKQSAPALETVYFGGGTPSLVPPRDMERILAAIRAGFSLRPDAEITLEANPESANDRTYLRLLRELGVNRLSLGVQSLDPDHLQTLGRIHTPEQAIQTLHHARGAGFTNVGLDFIWGIPGQTPAQWLGQLETVAAFRPEHLSCYGLSVEPETLLEQDLEAGSVSLPSEDDQASMFLEGSALLAAHGYDHYEISNFCLPGKQSRHNSGYWEGKEYLGLGPAAVSTIAKTRWTHPSRLQDYALAVEQGRLDANREQLSPLTLENERIMLALRTGRGLNLDTLCANASENHIRDLAGRIESLCSHGFADTVQHTLCLTPKGMLVSNDIISEFLLPQDIGQVR
jgi:oxygen-independent coproporphyrinogen-3 oxidase